MARFPWLRSIRSSRLGRDVLGMRLRGALAAAASIAALPTSAHAATWGAFDASRIAYATGSLAGDVHGQLRSIIMAGGHQIAPATNLLTAEYLEGVDVFYTAMLSDGTGPTAGGLGTLSLDEQTALQDWVAGGGTLIVTLDSNGFDGPFDIVYDSVLQPYGVGSFVFVFSFGTGTSVIAHPITEGVGTFTLDGTVAFDAPPDGQVLATVMETSDPVMAVFEPATGFTVGGRVLVLADHNALTDNYIAEADNTQLAENIVGWAAGECGNGIVESAEECDDGNDMDGDGCDNTCLAGAADSTGGSSGGEPGDSSGGSTGLASTGGDESTGALPADDGDGGCGCRSGDADAPWGAVWWLLPGLACLRRRRAQRVAGPLRRAPHQAGMG